MGTLKRKAGRLIALLFGNATKAKIGDYIQQRKMSGLSRQEKFEYIYRNRIWGDAEFDSGEGSADVNAASYVSAISRYMLDNNIRSVVDIGCGDFRVGRKIIESVPSLKYMGIDIAEPLIARNQSSFGSANISFLQLDVVEQVPPKADVYLVREVLQHLSNADVARALKNISGNVIVTEVLPHNYESAEFVPNIDIASGHMTRVEGSSGLLLTKPPFSLQAEILLSVPSESDPSKHLLSLLVRHPSGQFAT